MPSALPHSQPRRGRGGEDEWLTPGANGAQTPDGTPVQPAGLITGFILGRLTGAKDAKRVAKMMDAHHDMAALCHSLEDELQAKPRNAGQHKGHGWQLLTAIDSWDDGANTVRRKLDDDHMGVQAFLQAGHNVRTRNVELLATLGINAEEHLGRQPSAPGQTTADCGPEPGQ